MPRPATNTCAPVAFDAEAYLGRRFATKDCGHCFEGADGHTAYLDGYGDPVVVCLADVATEEAFEARAHLRDQLLGWLR